MSHPEFLKNLSSIFYKELQGTLPLDWDMGHSPISFFSCAAGGGARRKKSISEIPQTPAEGRRPLHSHLQNGHKDHFLVLEKFGMTHTVIFYESRLLDS